MVRLGAKQTYVRSWKMEGDTRKKNFVTIRGAKFIHNGSNTDHAINLGNILDWDVALLVVNKILEKRSEPLRGPSIPYQRHALKILRWLGVRVARFAFRGTIGLL